MCHDWMIEVLQDLRRYARDNELDEVEGNLKKAFHVMVRRDHARLMGHEGQFTGTKGRRPYRAN